MFLQRSKAKLINYKTVPQWKIIKAHRSQNLGFWLENGLKLPRQKKRKISLVLCSSLLIGHKWHLIIFFHSLKKKWFSFLFLVLLSAHSIGRNFLFLFLFWTLINNFLKWPKLPWLTKNKKDTSNLSENTFFGGRGRMGVGQKFFATLTTYGFESSSMSTMIIVCYSRRWESCPAVSGSYLSGWQDYNVGWTVEEWQ